MGEKQGGETLHDTIAAPDTTRAEGPGLEAGEMERVVLNVRTSSGLLLLLFIFQMVYNVIDLYNEKIKSINFSMCSFCKAFRFQVIPIMSSC